MLSKLRASTFNACRKSLDGRYAQAYEHACNFLRPEPPIKMHQGKLHIVY